MNLTTATKKLRTMLGAEVIVPEDPGYDEARALHNAMIDKRPAMIVRCGSATDIAAALEFARTSNLAVAVRGGGHNAAGLGVWDGALVIDLSLLEPLHSTLGPEAAAWRITGTIPPRSGNRASITAPRNVYATSDGGWVALSASTQAMTERLFRAIGRPDMIGDPRFRTNADRLEHVEEVDAVIGAFVGARSLAENLRFFEAAETTVAADGEDAAKADHP